MNRSTNNTCRTKTKKLAASPTISATTPVIPQRTGKRGPGATWILKTASITSAQWKTGSVTSCALSVGSFLVIGFGIHTAKSLYEWTWRKVSSRSSRVTIVNPGSQGQFWFVCLLFQNARRPWMCSTSLLTAWDRVPSLAHREWLASASQKIRKAALGFHF